MSPKKLEDVKPSPTIKSKKGRPPINKIAHILKPKTIFL